MMADIASRPFHEYAQLFPMLDDTELAELTSDIRTNGMHEPIVIYESQILDGRNRYLACRAANVEPDYVEYDGNDPLAFVVSMNLHRRHLTSSQRATVSVSAGNLVTKLREEAAARMTAGTSLPIDPTEKIREGETSEQLADLFGTNPRYVDEANNLKETQPDLFQQVHDGTLSIPQAKNERKRREMQDRAKEQAEFADPASAPDIRWNCGDFRQFIDGLEDGSLNVLLTDPPYGIEYQSGRRAVQAARIAGDDDHAHQLLFDALSMLYDKLATDAHLLVFCTWRNEHDVHLALESAGYNVIGSLIWVKNNHGSGNLKSAFAPKHERIVHAIKGKPALLRRIDDVLEAAKVSSDLHPTEKPLSLLQQLIDVTCPPGGIVADPFGGVGSTLAAAMNAGRGAWGCEIEERYWTVGKARLYAA